jgi:hypothetical protein
MKEGVEMCWEYNDKEGGTRISVFLRLYKERSTLSA